MSALRAFLRLQWGESLIDWRPMALSAIGLLLGLASQFFLGRFVGGGYSAFLILGLALLELQSSWVGALALRLREAQRSGALEVYVATPRSVPSLLLGLAGGDALFAVGRMLVYFVIGVVGFGVAVAGAAWLPVLAALVLGALAFVGLALLGAALTIELRRSDPLSMVLGALSIIAGEVLYPATVLPGWLSTLGRALPLRSALEVLRGGLRGECCNAALILLAVQSLVLLLLGGVAFWLAFARARRSGALAAP